MSKYVSKRNQVDAIQFIYDGLGIKVLGDFCGCMLRNYGKQRGINEKGWAWLGTPGTDERLVVNEGDYVVKEHDKLTVYPEKDFGNLFILVSKE